MRPVGMGILLIAGGIFHFAPGIHLQPDAGRHSVFPGCLAAVAGFKIVPALFTYFAWTYIYTDSPQFEELHVRNPFACRFMVLTFKKRCACYVLKQKT